MTDAERHQAQYWHADACRKAELIGGITAFVNAAQDTTARHPLTAEQAIDHIARLLTEYTQQADQHRGVGR